MNHGNGTSTATDSDPHAVVSRHVAEATAAFEAATCGHPLCRIGDGPDVMRPRFAEGGLAATSELDHLMKRGPRTNPIELAADTLAAWEEERRSCDDHGGPRVGYLNGGVAQLRNILTELESRSAEAASP
jgi:hypothetical protein